MLDVAQILQQSLAKPAPSPHNNTRAPLVLGVDTPKWEGT